MKLSKKEKLLNVLWWSLAIFSAFMLFGVIISIIEGLYVVETSSTQIVAILILSIIFTLLYIVSVRRIKSKKTITYQPVLYLFLGIFVLSIILFLVGFFTSLLGPSFEEEQENIYIDNTQNIRDAPQGNQESLYQNTTINQEYSEKVSALNSYLYGKELRCEYPETQVGQTCCIESQELPGMCQQESETLLQKYMEAEEPTTEGQIYNLKSTQIEIPWGYYLVENISYGGDIVDMMLITEDELGNYYEIRITQSEENYDFNHQELSYFTYNTLSEYFNSTISQLNFYKSGDTKISYFDYYIVDNFGDTYYNRFALAENNNKFYTVIYSGTSRDFIDEVSIITDSIQ